MDALGQRYSAADSLYNLYNETVKNLTMPVYNTMGNHEIYGIYQKAELIHLIRNTGKKCLKKELGNHIILSS